MKNPVIIGKIGSSYGVHGWLRIEPYTEFGPTILDYQPWFISANQQDWQEIEIEQSKIHTKNIIVKFVGVTSPESARLLTGKLVAIPKTRLPKLAENEFYWSDLIGLDVFTTTGQHLGKVIYIMPTGSNDVLVVKGDKEHAIPYLPKQVIIKIDLDQQQIVVDWEPL